MQELILILKYIKYLGLGMIGQLWGIVCTIEADYDAQKNQDKGLFLAILALRRGDVRRGPYIHN